MKHPVISEKTWAFLMLRLFLGLRFGYAFWSKLLDENFNPALDHLWTFCRNVVADFEKTFLPDVLVVPFVYVLPWLEITLAVMLLLGIFTRRALVVTGFLYVLLIFGVLLQHQWSTVADNALHLALAVGALLLVPHNRWTLWPRTPA